MTARSCEVIVKGENVKVSDDPVVHVGDGYDGSPVQANLILNGGFEIGTYNRMMISTRLPVTVIALQWTVDGVDRLDRQAIGRPLTVSKEYRPDRWITAWSP